jgi:hypothetical protein
MADNDPMVEHPLDAEDWEIAFQPFKGDPYAALVLAFNLIGLKRHIPDGPTTHEALAAIDRAVDVLFQYSQFRDVSYELFHAVIGGTVTVEQENALKGLGIKF